MAVSKVDAANQIENQLPQANIANNTRFRNIIINGDMSIAQRGTSTTGVTGGNYTVDRYRYSKNGNSPTLTITQDTDVPTGQGFAKSLKLEVTTVNAVASGDRGYLEQRFEGQNLQYLKKGTSSAESLTASFWVKASVTGTYIVYIIDSDNTRQIAKSYTINSANTWEKKTITFEGDTTGTLDNDNAISLNLNFGLYAGSNFTSGTLATSWEATTNANTLVGQVDAFATVNNTWQITGVQLEAGTTASDFEFLPYDVNLARCQRYYYNVGTGGASTTIFRAYVDAGGADIWQPHPFLMRAAPTITTEGTWTVASNTSQPSGRFQTTQGFSMRFTRSSGTGDAYVHAGGTDDRLTIDAEL